MNTQKKLHAPDFAPETRTPITRGRNNGMELRPWNEVAELYTERTGEPMTETRAQQIGKQALDRLIEAVGRYDNAQIRATLLSAID